MRLIYLLILLFLITVSAYSKIIPSLPMLIIAVPCIIYGLFINRGSKNARQIGKLAIVKKECSLSKGFKVGLQLDLDQRLGMKEIAGFENTFSKAKYFIYEFINCLEVIKNGIIVHDEFYDDIEYISGTSNKIKPELMSSVGFEISLCRNVLERLFLKVNGKMLRVVYKFEENRASDQETYYNLYISKEDLLSLDIEAIKEKYRINKSYDSSRP